MPHRHTSPQFQHFPRFPGFACHPCRLFLLILTVTLLPGCTVVKVADVAASTAIGVTAGTVKLTGKAIGAAIPDGDNDDEDEERKRESEDENDN